MKIAPLALAISLAFVTPSYALTISSSISTAASISTNGLWVMGGGAGGERGEGATSRSVVDGPANSASSVFSWNGSPTWDDLINWNHFDDAVYAVADETGFSALQSTGPHYSGCSYSSCTSEVRSRVLQTATITNDSAVAQEINFNFLINSGAMQVDSAMPIDEFGHFFGNSNFQVGYAAAIRVNGNNQWFSAAQLTTNILGEDQLTTSGVTLGDWADGWHNDYVWDAYSGELNLGVLGAGQSLTLDYELSTFVNVYMDSQGYSHYPNVTIGDPYGFSSTPVFAPEQFVTTVVPSVPEPETVAMYGVGLAALAFRRKSRKVQA